MATKTPRGYGRRNDPDRARHDINAFVNMARSEGIDDPEVWIVNKTSDKISMEIDVPGSDDPIHLDALPMSPHPYNLTSEVELEVLVKSRNFKKLLGQVFRDRMNPAHPLTGQPVLELWTTDEAEAHYNRFAQRAGRHWQEVAAEEAEKRARLGQVQEQHYSELAGFAAPRSAVELAGLDMARRGITATSSHGLSSALDPQQAMLLLQEEQQLHERLGVQGRPGMGQLYIADHVAPRVMQLCHESSAAIEEGGRMPAAEFISELSSMEHTLTESDLDYIQAHGTYRQVKEWAGRLRREKFPDPGLEAPEGIEGPFGSVSAGTSQVAGYSNVPVVQGPSRAAPGPAIVTGPAARTAVQLGSDGAGLQYEGPAGFANGPGALRTHAESGE